MQKDTFGKKNASGILAFVAATVCLMGIIVAGVVVCFPDKRLPVLRRIPEAVRQTGDAPASSGGPVLKVAAGAIISPKDTEVHSSTM